jgi:hypothetical protein
MVLSGNLLGVKTMIVVQFQGSSAAMIMELRRVVTPQTLDDAIRVAKRAAERLGEDYYWCGIFEDDQLVKEFTFDWKFNVKI